MKFKSGMRRVKEKWPTEYKLQYGWKNPAALPAPLMKAQEALRDHPMSPNKPADQHWSAESLDGDSCDARDSGLDSPTEQEAKRTVKPPTAAVKKRWPLQQQKQKAKTQPVSSRLPQNVTATRHSKHRKVPRNQPWSAPNKTTVSKKLIEQDDDATAGSDTDSQTGQKLLPQQQATDTHYRCGHKKRKKRSVKRKLLWPMVTEYQSQYKTKAVLTAADDDDNDGDDNDNKVPITVCVCVCVCIW